jgi:hypothetical protein
LLLLLLLLLLPLLWLLLQLLPIASSILRTDDNAHIRRYQPYKLVVAFENTVQPGYVTEKLLLANLAGAVPVFWGHSATAARIFNTLRYIDCGDFVSLPACARHVQRVAADPNLLLSYLREPALRGECL